MLVPASLTIESITSPYVLSLHEDEIVVNPTLSYKLENDFGIILPKYNEGDDLRSIFAEVSRLIKANGWEVVFESSLSLLSFLKINMYNDLSKHKDSIASNPIVRTISGMHLLLTKFRRLLILIMTKIFRLWRCVRLSMPIQSAGCNIMRQERY